MTEFTQVITATFVALGLIYALTLLIWSIWLSIVARNLHKETMRIKKHFVKNIKKKNE